MIHSPKLLNVSTVAAILDAPYGHVMYLIHTGRLKALRIGHKSVRVREEDLEQFIAAAPEVTTAQ